MKSNKENTASDNMSSEVDLVQLQQRERTNDRTNGTSAWPPLWDAEWLIYDQQILSRSTNEEILFASTQFSLKPLTLMSASYHPNRYLSICCRCVADYSPTCLSFYVKYCSTVTQHFVQKKLVDCVTLNIKNHPRIHGILSNALFVGITNNETIVHEVWLRNSFKKAPVKWDDKGPA